MSQQNKRPGNNLPPHEARKKPPTGQSTKRPANQPARRAQAGTGRPSNQPVKRPVGQVGRQSQSSFKSQVDRALPPFSVRRYMAIWVPMTAILVIILLVLLWGLNNKGSSDNSPAAAVPTTAAGASGGAASTPAAGATTAGAVAAGPTATLGPGKYLVIDTAKGQIVAKLYTDASAKVANTVANFEKKANSGYFNGLIFHRVEDWVIQGGDPQGTGSGGGQMPSEYNSIHFKTGSLGVARGQDPAINNDSQFFITKSEAAWLDGQYTNWGEVVQGMDVVDKIAIGDKMTKVTVENR